MVGDDAHGEEFTKWDNHSKEGPKLNTDIWKNKKNL